MGRTRWASGVRQGRLAAANLQSAASGILCHLRNRFQSWILLSWMETLMPVTASDFGRREFIAFIGGMTAWTLASHAQGAERMRRIGMLMNLSGSDPEAPIRVAAFLQRLQELGWTDRRNIQIDYRLVSTDSDQQKVVAELIALEPDILVVKVSFKAWNIPAAILRVSPTSGPRWGQNGCSCSRK